MLEAPVAAQRLLARLRPDPTRRSDRATALERRGLALARRLAVRPGPGPLARFASRLAGRPRLPGALGGLLERERVLPVGLALLVVVASFASTGAVPAARGTTGEVAAAAATPRLAIAGLAAGLDPGRLAEGPAAEGALAPAAGAVAAGAAVSRLGELEATIAAADAARGPARADATLQKPVVVDTSVADGRALLRSYRVRPGDTLTGIARRFGVSMMTVWWANELSSKDDLTVGQTLVIPPVSGLVVTVAEGDTLASIAAATGVAAEAIYAFNGLEDEALPAGATLIVPGARGEAIPTPKPVPVRRSSGGATGAVRTPVSYGGGAFAWPVAGGYISQYFHYGHYGLDIAADYGTPVRAAAAGTVVFVGWKNNGGGYQVWLAHGSGLYTGYYHMSRTSVVRGQTVGRGAGVGRIGTSGWATGPHLHFEVWVGPIYEGYQVNPLRYF